MKYMVIVYSLALVISVWKLIILKLTILDSLISITINLSINIKLMLNLILMLYKTIKILIMHPLSNNCILDIKPNITEIKIMIIWPLGSLINNYMVCQNNKIILKIILIINLLKNFKLSIKGSKAFHNNLSLPHLKNLKTFVYNKTNGSKIKQKTSLKIMERQ
jgi:hypothetical protein